MAELAAGGAVVLGVLADTHGWLDPALETLFAGTTAVVHAGDVGAAEVLERLGVVAPVYAVRGNIDAGPLADLPEELVLPWEGCTVAVRHICGPPSRPSPAARRLVAGGGATVLVCGHSHGFVAERRGGYLWLNPGAAGHEGFHQERTAALLAIAPGGGQRVKLVRLGPRGRRA